MLCAGQESQRALLLPLMGSIKTKVFLIGGAEHAGELDAKRAIDQGTRLYIIIIIIIKHKLFLLSRNYANILSTMTD